MRFAIIESGGKQYRAIEGRTIQVDRLAMETGEKFNIERVLLMADDDNIMVGTPTVDGIEVKVTVADHIRGPKIDRFKYRPKKRIRVRGGHRQHYTLLMVDFIGKPGEVRKVEKPEVKKEVAAEVVEVAETKPKAEKKAKAEKPVKTEKEAAKPSTKKAPVKKAPAKKTTTSKTSSKKTDTKKK